MKTKNSPLLGGIIILVTLGIRPGLVSILSHALVAAGAGEAF